MRRVMGLALAIVLASLLAWWLVGRGTAPEPAETVDRPREATEPGPPRLEGDAPDPTGRPESGDRIDRHGPKSPREDYEPAPVAVTLLVVRAGEGSPIEGATVRTAEGEIEITNARGRATVNVVSGTTCVVRKLGFATRWVDVGTSEATVRVELTPAPVLTGRVVDATTGEALPAARIVVWIKDMPWEGADAPEPTDETGAFHVAGVPPGEMFEVRVVRPGYATAVIHVGSPDEGDTPLEVRLGEGAEIEGTVRDAAGPVADANVFVVARGTDLPPDARPCQSEVLAHGITDATGHYRVRGLEAPTEIAVHARHPSGGAGRSEPVSLPHDRALATVNVRISTDGGLVVRLVHAKTGEHVEAVRCRCSIDVDWSHARDDQKQFRTTEDRDAWFPVVPAGTHRLYVDPHSYLAPAPFDVEVRPGETRVVTVEVDPGLEVTGRVVDSQGNPLEVYVCFDTTYGGVAQYTHTRTDAKTGRFTLKAVAPAPGTLHVFDQAVADRLWKDIEISGDLGDLVLPLRPHLVGRVPEGYREQSIECGVITKERGGRSGGLDVAEDGTFRVDGLFADDPTTVYFRPAKGAALVLRDVVLKPGEVRDLGEIAFPEPLSLEGTLLDATGAPVRGAMVRPADWWCWSRTRTDADGRFRLGNLPPGKNTLWIEATSLAVTFHDVQMREGMAPIEVRLPEPGTLKIRLVKENGETLPNVPMNVVRLLDTGEPDWDRRKIVKTDSRGLLDEKLPPGPYGVIPHDNAHLEVVGETMKVLIVSNRTTEADITVK